MKVDLSKYKIIVITLVAIAAFLGVFMFVSSGFLFLVNPFSSCASIGVERLSDNELNRIKSSQPEIKFLEITENDLKTLPKLKQVIDAVGDRVEFNTHGRVVLSHEEAEAYHTFLSAKNKQQYGLELNQDPFLWVTYDGKTYVIDGFVFTTTPNDIELAASRQEVESITPINITDDDFRSIPGIKKAIDEIGSYQTSPFNNTGLPEDEQKRYMDWFEEKFEEQYGSQEHGSYSSYFHYNGRYYAPNFSIC